jgi:hypothetical protein
LLGAGSTQLICADNRVFSFSKSEGGEYIVQPAERRSEVQVAEAGELRLELATTGGLQQVSLLGEILGPDSFDGVFAFDRIRDLQIMGRYFHLVSRAGWHVFSLYDSPSGSAAHWVYPMKSEEIGGNRQTRDARFEMNDPNHQGSAGDASCN